MKNIFKIMLYVCNKNMYELIFIKYIYKYRLILKIKKILYIQSMILIKK